MPHDDGAHAMAGLCRATSATAVRDALRAVADTGADEVILVATTTDPDVVGRAADIVTTL
jgi:hypothetical protein